MIYKAIIVLLTAFYLFVSSITALLIVPLATWGRLNLT